ncbi:DNA polymerase alpha subunit B [Artomyces pyxidatus]|uniref:DNA polymerase alpha subunit B n=1 Tax=Artomyces pyxidatus TaxID=48021 RepID=A0ACB8SNQ9_9AGAM|nr:DNA polymerase alpha subunit B [Artomyces pyxidatus]
MATSNMRQELKSAFETTPGCDDAFIDRCAELCNTYNVTPSNLYYKWESIVLDPKAVGNRIITPDTPAAIKSIIQAELARAALSQRVKAEPSSKKARGGAPVGMLGIGGRMNQRYGGVGLIQTPKPGASSALQSKNAIGRRSGTSKVVFQSLEIDEASQDKRSYKYMYEKISERSEVLDERIDEFADLVRKHYDVSELSDPAASTDDDVVVVGRITLDAEASSSSSVKLNEASLYLESSRMMGSGARVALKFDVNARVRGGPKGRGSVGLFPGAIVALKGKNGGGGWFSVGEILSLPPLTPSSAENPTKQEPRDSSFSMVVASGPYTADADLRYTPWSSLQQQLLSQKPAVVLLIGPFVDSSHPKIKAGDLDETPVDMFNNKFTESLRDFLDISPDSLVLLVPSVRDMLSNHCAFPQSQLGPELAGDTRIKLLPNPSRFSLNGVAFAVTSVDVLFHLRKEELVKKVEEIDSYDLGGHDPAIDTMSNLCRHMLQQRTFYPLFPTPFDLSHEVNLDVSHLESLRLCSEDAPSTAPDVLIVPSRLKHFSKVVDNTVAVNPSFLTKNTFASLSYGGQGDGPVIDRLKAEIARLSEAAS